jgi:hypothetical protein
MPITTYEEIHKDKIEYKIHERYKREIDELTALGFGDLHFTREVTFPLSALLMFWVYLPMKFGGEIFTIEKPLRYVLLNPLLLNYQYDSYVNIFSMGVKFVTMFSDNTCLISCNYDTRQYVNPQKGVFRYSSRHKIAIHECFEQHINHIAMLEKAGHQTDEALSLPRFEESMVIDDKVLLYMI